MDAQKNRIPRKPRKSRFLISFLIPLFVFCLLLFDVKAEMLNRVVATVNHEVITQYDLNLAAKELAKQLAKKQNIKEFKITNEFLSEVLSNLINDALVRQEMEKKKIEVSEKDLEQAFNNILTRNKMSLEDLKKELSAQGMSLAEYRNDLKKQIKRVRFMNQTVGQKVRITDDEVQEYYEKNFSKLKSNAEVEVAQIVIPLALGASEKEIKQAEKRAQEIYKQAKSKKVSFEDLLLKLGGEGSGNLGKISFSSLAPQIAAALQNLNQDQVSEPVRTELGFVIVKLLNSPSENIKMSEEVKEEIRGRIYDEKLQEELLIYLDQLKSTAYIEIKTK